ncbi:hypothetical protein ABFX02_14G093500 [Erythranthe guttata]
MLHLRKKREIPRVRLHAQRKPKRPFVQLRRFSTDVAAKEELIADVAKGLGYLHYGVKPAVFHGDLKATNVLLDNDLKAGIADFGLAKQSREGEMIFEKSDV